MKEKKVYFDKDNLLNINYYGFNLEFKDFFKNFEAELYELCEIDPDSTGLGNF